MTLDTKVACTCFVLSITGFLFCIPAIVQREARTTYFTGLPTGDGQYNVYIATECFASLEIESLEENSKKYSTDISISFRGTKQDLHSNAGVTTDSNGIIHLIAFSLKGRGVSLKGQYRREPNKHVLLNGNFFSQPLSIDTSIDSDLQLVQDEIERGSLSGPQARAPLQQTVQASIIRQLEQVSFSNKTESCSPPYDVTALINHILDIQNTTPDDILSFKNSK